MTGTDASGDDADTRQDDPNAERDELDEMELSVEVTKGLIGKVVQAVVGFLVAVVAARVLGPDKFGGYYVLLTLVQLAIRPMIGFSNAAMKRFSEHGTSRQSLVGTQLLFDVTIVAAAALLVVPLGPLMSSYTGVTGAGQLFFVMFVGIVVFGSFQQLLPARGKLGVQVMIDTVRSLLTTALQLTLVVSGLGAAGMAYGFSGAALLAAPITHYYLRTVPTVPAVETVKSVWRFARYSILSRITGHAYDRLDILLITFLITPAAAGQYEAALKFVIPATFVSALAGTGLMNTVSNAYSRGEPFEQTVRDTLSLASIVAVPLVFGSLAVARPLVVTTFGGEYAQAATLLPLLAVFALVRSQSKPLQDVISGLDFPNLVTRISVLTLVVNVAIGIPLILRDGALGAVVATVAAETLRYTMFHLVVRRRTEARLLTRPMLEQLAAGAVMSAVVFVFRLAIAPVTGWVEMASLLGVGAAVYAVVLWSISRVVRQTVVAVYTATVEAYVP